MMFIITDTDPKEAVRYFVDNAPRRLWTKQLLELSRLVCSAGFSKVYKKVSSGKEIQKWIRKNVTWVHKYYGELLKYCLVDSYYDYSPETVAKFYSIYKSLEKQCFGIYIDSWEPEKAIFRFNKDYLKTSYTSNSEIPIKDCVKEYKKYLSWKVKALEKSN